MKKTSLLLAVLFLLYGSSPSYCENLEWLSKSHSINQVYPSMDGPWDNYSFQFQEKGEDEPELIWLTSAKLEIVDANNHAKISPEYLCHANLSFILDKSGIHKRNALFGHTTSVDKKILDLVQGHIEIKFPEGFGVPLISNERLRFHSMVFNPTMDEEPFDLKVKATFEYLHDRNLKHDMKPLFRRGLTLAVPIEDSHHRREHHHVGLDQEDNETFEAASNKLLINTRSGRATYHWLVPPGRHTYRQTLENGLRISFDTTVHLIAVHLHPFAEYVELRDLTTDKTIFRSDVENLSDRVGIATLSQYSSQEGFPIFYNHEYEMITVYNNTTSSQIDAMAVMYLYYWDKNFDKSLVRLK